VLHMQRVRLHIDDGLRNNIADAEAQRDIAAERHIEALTSPIYRGGGIRAFQMHWSSIV
jgi:hypothetical protein